MLKPSDYWRQQLPDESPPAFAAFLKYRNLGSARSINGAYSVSKGRARASGRWSTWSAKNHWVERAAAFDEHIQAVKAEAGYGALRSLELERGYFAIEFFRIQKNWLADVEVLMNNKMAAQPVTDFTQTKTDPQGSITHTKVTGLRPADYGALLAAGDALITEAVLGPGWKDKQPQSKTTKASTGRTVWKTESGSGRLKKSEFWRQLAGESLPAFAAFLIYRDLGSARSIAGAYSSGKGRALATSGRWSTWSAKHDWVARAAAFDAHTEAADAGVRDAALRLNELGTDGVEIPSFSMKIPGESALAFAAFLKYRDLGTARSMDSAYSIGKGRALAASGQWSRWSAKHHWVERAAAFEAHTEAVKAAAGDADLRSVESQRGQWKIDLFRFQVRRLAQVQVVLDKLSAQPVTGVSQTKTDAEGNITRTIVKRLRVRDYVALLAAGTAIGNQAVLGPRGRTSNNRRPRRRGSRKSF